MAYRIDVPAVPAAADRMAILQQLIDANVARAGPSGHQDLAILIRDTSTGATAGGLWGVFIYDWLYIELLVVPEPARGTGLGTELLRHAEDAARRRRVVGLWLNTYGFQAPAFYEKNGFEQFGRLDGAPGGGGGVDKSLVFYRKHLAA